MYCIKCGVELADSEKVCPLCGTRVFHPDLPCGQAESPYPPDVSPRVEDVSRAGVLFVLTVLFLLPAVISVLCDWRLSGGIVWSGYVVGGLVLLYTTVVLPWISPLRSTALLRVLLLLSDSSATFRTVPLGAMTANIPTSFPSEAKDTPRMMCPPPS